MRQDPMNRRDMPSRIAKMVVQLKNDSVGFHPPRPLKKRQRIEINAMSTAIDALACKAPEMYQKMAWLVSGVLCGGSAVGCAREGAWTAGGG